MDLDGISIGPGPRTLSVASYASSFGGAHTSPKTLAPREHERLFHSRARLAIREWVGRPAGGAGSFPETAIRHACGAIAVWPAASQCRRACKSMADYYCCLRRNRCTLPLGVFGSSARNAISRR